MAVRLLLWAVLATLLPDSVAAWRSPPPPTLDRRAAASGVAAALLLPLTARPASAGDGKDDKAFQKCLSQCVYEKTKITKGIAQVEVVGRTEAYAECKPKCATSKEQLLIGKPKK